MLQGGHEFELFIFQSILNLDKLSFNEIPTPLLIDIHNLLHYLVQLLVDHLFQFLYYCFGDLIFFH